MPRPACESAARGAVKREITGCFMRRKDSSPRRCVWKSGFCRDASGIEGLGAMRVFLKPGCGFERVWKIWENSVLAGRFSHGSHKWLEKRVCKAGVFCGSIGEADGRARVKECFSCTGGGFFSASSFDHFKDGGGSEYSFVWKASPKRVCGSPGLCGCAERRVSPGFGLRRSLR